jgi:hypothetical protein
MAIGIEYYSTLKPVNLTLTDDTANLDSVTYGTQQGSILTEYNFLLSSNDCIIKNYTDNYLTFNFSKEDIMDEILPERLNNSIVTQLYIEDTPNQYVTLIPNSLVSASQATITASNSSYAQNFVIDFYTLTSGENICLLWSYDKYYKKYLFVRENISNTLIFSPASATYFNYLYDSDNNIINLFCTLTSGTGWLVYGAPSSAVYSLSVGTPSALNKTRINFLTNRQARDTNVYNTQNFVLYTSGVNIDNNNSLTNIKNNFLVYSPYETWTPSATSVDGNVDLFNLKNYTSKNNFVNRVPFFKNKQQRNYNAIITNDYQETSNEKLQLGFNFFTKEYLITPDKYTKFTLPDTIAPFTRININDSGLKEAGAYAATSPYFSDRVYKLLDNNKNVNTANESNGIFLCSWFNIIDGIWYDRYYIPQNTSYINALSSSTSQVFTFKSELDSFVENIGLTKLNFYDIQSALMFEPNSTYYYARIGNKYIENVLSGKDVNLLRQTIIPYDINTGNEEPETEQLLLNGSVYDSFDIGSIGTGRFNVSFRIKAKDFENAKAYQLLGNNYNIGFALRKNFYFTPFIIIQQNNAVYFYDTDFNLIKKNTYDPVAVGNISDICYVSQTTDIVLRTSNGLFRTDITGQIINYNTDIPDGIKTSVASRHFYGKGNKAIFTTKNVSPCPVYITDLQTLVTALSTTLSNGASSVITTSTDSTFTLPGEKGININDTFGASLSSDKYVLFTNLPTNTSYVGLSTVYKIDDISSHDNNLYIQSNNSLKIFNTDRELLSTISLSESAVNGFKIDFISEDYKTLPLIFSRDTNNNIIADKISLTTGKILSTYSLSISSVSGNNAFVNCTGFYFAENTYKNYEDKLCLTVNLPNTFITQTSARVWSTYAHSWSAITPVSYWAFNYSSVNVLNDNSIIDVIPLQYLDNHIDMDFNLLDGVINVYVNGVLTNSISTPTNLLSIDTIVKNILYLGNQNYSDKSITDYITNQKIIATGFDVSDFNIYNISLSDDFIKYLYMRGITIDNINIDFTCDDRNSIETVDNIFKYNIPGRLSNKVLVYIKGLDVDSTTASSLTSVVNDRVRSILPSNISDITYNLDIR